MKSMIYKFPLLPVPRRSVISLPGPGSRVLSCGEDVNHDAQRIDPVVWIEFEVTEDPDDVSSIEVMTAWTGVEFDQEIRVWLFAGTITITMGDDAPALVLHVYWRPMP